MTVTLLVVAAVVAMFELLTVWFGVDSRPTADDPPGGWFGRPHDDREEGWRCPGTQQ